MREDSITIQEACKILHRSEKQVRRHIKTGRLSAEIGQDGKYYILKNDVDTMARHPERMQVDKVAGHIERLDRRIAEIENRLDTLTMHVDEIIDALYAMSEPPTASQRVNTPTSIAKPTVAHSVAIQGLSDDLVTFTDFYKAHNISESTARRVLELNQGSALSGNWNLEGKAVKHVLDATGCHVFYEAFKTKSSFLPCPNCPH